jgi:hypothetical protein
MTTAMIRSQCPTDRARGEVGWEGVKMWLRRVAKGEEGRGTRIEGEGMPGVQEERGWLDSLLGWWYYGKGLIEVQFSAVQCSAVQCSAVQLGSA